MKHAILIEMERRSAQRRKLTLGLSFGAVLAGALGVLRAAEGDTAPANAPLFKLGTYVVNGQPFETTSAVETRVTGETLELLEKKDLAEALSTVPGVTLTRFGGRNETAVYVRGFARNQTPLFVDGIPLYVPYDGIIDLGRFTTYDIAAIDVAKGYSSALFGPNTMGGAINIVTRRPTQPFEGQLETGVFTGNGFESSLNAGAKQNAVYAQVGASYVTQDYYRISGSFTPVALEDGGHRDNSYRHDWRVSAKVGYTPNATDEYAVGFIHQEGEKGNPVQTTSAKYWQWPEWNKQTIYALSNTQLGTASYIKPRAYYDTYDNSLAIFDDATYSTQNKSSSSTSIYNEYSYGGSLELGTALLPNQTLKGTTQYKFDHHKEYPDVGRKPTTSYIDEDATVSFGLEDTAHLTTALDAQVGVSYDSRRTHVATDTTTGLPFAKTRFVSSNPQGGLFYKLSPRDTLRLTVAHKSRFPSMKERYSYRMGSGIPNASLKAESAMHYELGYVSVLRPGLHFDASTYFSRVSDTIQQVYLSPTSTVSQFQNIGTTDRYGLDLGLDWTLTPAVSVGAGAAYLHQKSLTTLPKNTESVKLTDTPSQTGSLHAKWTAVPWLDVVPSAEFSGWRYSYSDGKGTTRTVGGFALYNLKLAFRLPHRISVSVGVENLLDKNYVLQEGYPEAGRSWFANARYAF